jgi:chromosome segregation ATPase
MTDTNRISCRIIDYINEKLEQMEYYKRHINPVDVLHFIKEEVLAYHDLMATADNERTQLQAEAAKLRARVQELEGEVTHLAQRPLAVKCQELERENARLHVENTSLSTRQRDLASMGVFEDILRHPRTV